MWKDNPHPRLRVDLDALYHGDYLLEGDMDTLVESLNEDSGAAA